MFIIRITLLLVGLLGLFIGNDLLLPKLTTDNKHFIGVTQASLAVAGLMLTLRNKKSGAIFGKEDPKWVVACRSTINSDRRTGTLLIIFAGIYLILFRAM